MLENPYNLGYLARLSKKLKILGNQQETKM